MLVLRFASEAVWRDCCDAVYMRHRWGSDRARRLSRRLQQLEAMTSLDDLDFMPFNSHEHVDGSVEVVIDDDSSLLMREVDQQQEDAPMLHATTVLISAVNSRSIAVP